ncbi:MAG TPA: hypothetical protein VJZ01_07870 [Lachnospiraceae bacterium]|nr:hypothetical protein [Lachnospiraceae bacterium]
MSKTTNMIRKKTGFFTFIFSLFPGCGETYLGFYKNGVSMMLLAFGVLGLSMFSGTGIIMMFFPVLWFYSFCHVHNLVALSDEEFYAVEDNYVFDLPDDSLKGVFKTAKTRTCIGVICIVIGICALWDTMRSFLYRMFDQNIWDVYIEPFFDYVPQVIIGGIVIALGVILIRGKKKELDEAELKQIEDKNSNGGEV